MKKNDKVSKINSDDKSLMTISETIDELTLSIELVKDKLVNLINELEPVTVATDAYLKEFKSESVNSISSPITKRLRYNIDYIDYIGMMIDNLSENLNL